MKKVKQLGIATLSALLLSSTTLPAFASAQVANENSPINLETELDNKEIHLNPRIELELMQVDYNELFRNITTDLGIYNGPASGEVGTMGLKSKLAKEAAIEIAKKVKNVGQRAWDATVNEYVNKLPIPQGAKTTLKVYLGYSGILQVTDWMIDFTGTAEEGLSKGFQALGLPAWLADFASRAIVFFLL